ncbi:hypothetical protein SAMN05518672_101516 [Chitinophaga sp. CF118]|nr:hypothetical protein SAMN05518672_101516 [Chitinophaga sp. CF118]
MREANISFSCSAVINLLSTFLQRFCSMHLAGENELCSEPNTIQVLAAFTRDGFFFNKFISIKTVV